MNHKFNCTFSSSNFFSILDGTIGEFILGRHGYVMLHVDGYKFSKRSFSQKSNHYTCAYRDRKTKMFCKCRITEDKKTGQLRYATAVRHNHPKNEYDRWDWRFMEKKYIWLLTATFLSFRRTYLQSINEKYFV